MFMSSSRAPLSPALQSALDTSGMHPDAKVLLDQPRQSSTVEGGLLGQCCFERVQHRVRELVRPPRSGPPRHQAGQAGLPESILGLVEGGAGEAEGRTALTHLLTLLSNPTEHLVLHLNEIVGIEEGIARGKGRIAHRLGPGIEGVVAPKGGSLVGRRVGESQGHPPYILLILLCHIDTSLQGSDIRYDLAHMVVSAALYL